MSVCACGGEGKCACSCVSFTNESLVLKLAAAFRMTKDERKRVTLPWYSYLDLFAPSDRQTRLRNCGQTGRTIDKQADKLTHQSTYERNK